MCSGPPNGRGQERASPSGTCAFGRSKKWDVRQPAGGGWEHQVWALGAARRGGARGAIRGPPRTRPPRASCGMSLPARRQRRRQRRGRLTRLLHDQVLTLLQDDPFTEVAHVELWMVPTLFGE